MTRAIFVPPILFSINFFFFYLFSYYIRLIEDTQLSFHNFPPHIHIGLYFLYVAKKALKTKALTSCAVTSYA